MRLRIFLLRPEYCLRRNRAIGSWYLDLNWIGNWDLDFEPRLPRLRAPRSRQWAAIAVKEQAQAPRTRGAFANAGAHKRWVRDRGASTAIAVKAVIAYKYMALVSHFAIHICF